MPIFYVFINIFAETSDTWIHIKNYLLFDYVKNSLIIVLSVAAITIFIGVTLAWIISMYSFPGVNVFKWLVILPMAIPVYVNGYIYAGLNETSGLLFNFFDFFYNSGHYIYDLYDVKNIYGAIFILSISLYPYVYLLCLPALATHSKSIFEVGDSMGLSEYEKLKKIGLPIIRPAVIAGVSFVIMETLAEYATVKYFGVATFATGIFRSWYVLGDENSSFYLSSILLILVFLIIYFEQYTRGARKFYNPVTKISPMEKDKIDKKYSYALSSFCTLIILLGFIIPVMQLLYWASYSLDEVDINFIFNLVSSSISVALVASLVIIIFTINVAYLTRSKKSLFNVSMSKILSVGYAIPGVVLAVAVIGPISFLENTLPTIFNLEPESIFSGTFILLITAYLIRFSTISLKTFDSGLNKISKSYDLVSLGFGLTRLQTLFKVHLPILLPSIYTAGILVLVDILKELPVTLILRPFNFNTLPTYLYELAESENLPYMGVPGLFLILICLIPVIILSKGLIKYDKK